MSQPDPVHATVRRARPATTAVAAPLRVVSERVHPEAAAGTVAMAGPAVAGPAAAGAAVAGPAVAGPAPGGPAVTGRAQLRAAVTGPAQLRAAFRDAAATPAPLTVAPCPQLWPAPAWSSHLAVDPAGIAADTPSSGGAELVPARSLLPVPAYAPRPLLARLLDLLAGRRDPAAGRHRPDSIESPTWSMCAQRRRRSRWRTR